MSIKFNPDGSIVMDNVNDALVFDAKRRRKGKQKTRPSFTKGTPNLRSASTTGWQGFCQALKDPSAANARKILALVKGRSQEGISLDELAEALAAPVNVVSGTITGVIKRAVKFSLDPGEVILRENRLVRAGPLLAQQEPPTP